MSENQDKKNPIDYFQDRAIDTKNKDKFKHHHYVTVLKDILLKSETPINIGLYGKWGVGKSSIVHMLKEAISNEEELKKFKYVEVDAWGLSKTSLQQGILEEINLQLDEKAYQQNELEDLLYNTRETNSYNIKKKLRRSWRKLLGIGISISIIISIIAYISIPWSIIISILIILGTLLASLGTLLASIVKSLGISKKIIPRAVSSYQFTNIYKHIIETSKKKVVVIIDNLDRCEDKVAVELLGLIQTFMVKKNCINILACDDEAIVKHLKNVKGAGYNDRDGNEFLSKFFQVTIQIPPFIGENLEKYAEDLMNARSIKFDSFVLNILISGAIENPRKINQFLNNAVALYRLAELKENDQKLPKGIITTKTDFLVKMIVIKHEWPEFYKDVEEKPEILNNQADLEEWLNHHQKQPHYLRLKKFLNATQFSIVDDVIPFLRLNQESYAAESEIEEFANALITNDTMSVKIFSNAELEIQNQYLKKIENIMDKNETKNNVASQINCIFSLIEILKLIDDKNMRNRALAILGRHLSSMLLEQWDRFDIEKYDLFSLLEEMLPQFSEKFYDKLIYEIFHEKNINQKLFDQFMQNGKNISESTMNKLDTNFDKIIESQVNLEILVKCCNEYKWNENNISKPSKTVSHVIRLITFDPSGSDNLFQNVYSRIEKDIDSTERGIFFEQVRSSILQARSDNQIFSAPLMTVLQKISEEEVDKDVSQKERIFEILSKPTNDLPPNMIQHEQVFYILLNLAEKLKNSDNTSIDIDTKLESGTAWYLSKSNHTIILNFLKKTDSRLQNMLESNAVVSALITQFIVIGPNNTDIFRYLLKNIPYESQQNVAEKFTELLQSEDPAQYSTLLTVAQELDEDFNPSIIDSLRKTCKEIALDEDSGQLTFYQHVLHLEPTYSDIDEITKHAEELMDNNDIAIQNQGLELLKDINSRFDLPRLYGVEKTIETSIKFLQDNSEQVIPYLTFIFQHATKLNAIHKRKLKNLIREGLKPERTDNIINNLLAYIKQSPTKIIAYVFSEIIRCSETAIDNVKNQCRQILIDNKEQLTNIQENSVKRIFGDNVLD